MEGELDMIIRITKCMLSRKAFVIPMYSGFFHRYELLYPPL